MLTFITISTVYGFNNAVRDHETIIAVMRCSDIPDTQECLDLHQRILRE